VSRINIVIAGEPVRLFAAALSEPVTLAWLLRRIAAHPASRDTVIGPGEYKLILGRVDPDEIRIPMPRAGSAGNGGER